MLKSLLKILGFAALLGLPTCWLYYFWTRNASMPMEIVVLPWPFPYNVMATLPEAMLVAAVSGLLIGSIGVFVLFGGARRTSRKKLRGQIDRLRHQLAESEAQVEALKSRKGSLRQAEEHPIEPGSPGV